MTDEELIEQVARALCRNSLGSMSDEVRAQLIVDASWEAWEMPARAILPIIKAEVDKWQEPIIDELMSCHIYRREHEADPRKALHEVIAWNCRVALDPAVSAEARALMVRGGEMVREAAHESVADVYGKGGADYCFGALSVPAIVEAGDGKK